MRESQSLEIQRIGPEDWQRWRELRLAALTEAPYAFRSTLAEWQGEGDTEQRWRARLTEVPFNLLAEWDGRNAGMVSGTQPDSAGTVEMISMYVAPFARGQGLADALVESVIDWAASQGAQRIILGVAAGNERAAALYRKHGFTDTETVAGNCGHSYCETRMVRELRPGELPRVTTIENSPRSSR